MEPRVIQIGNLIPDREGKFHNAHRGRVYSIEGIAPCMHTCGGGNLEPKILLEMEEKEIIPYNTPEDGVAPTITTMYARLGTNNLTPGEYGGAMGIMGINKDSMVCEPTKVIGSMQQHAYQGSVDGISPCVNAAAGMGGGHIPMVVEEPLKIPQATKQGYIECPVGGVFDASYPNSELRRGRVQENGEVSPALTTNSEGAILRYEGIEPQVLTPLRTEEGRQLRKQGIEKFSNRALYPREDGVSNTITSVQKDNLLQEPKRRYRIRKLTEREVFRLMGLEDVDIDKIQAAGISKTAQYKLAGNSIVVSCLYHIFRKMFIEQACEDGQLSLF